MKIMNLFTPALRVATLIILLASIYASVSSNMSHASAPAKTTAEVPTGKPDAMIDLGSSRWRESRQRRMAL